MGQKVTIRFWWESGLSSASRNHLTTFCRPFDHYACLIRHWILQTVVCVRQSSRTLFILHCLYSTRH